MSISDESNRKINYEQEYRILAQKFWSLQQVAKTDEEKKYDELCNTLEEMAKQYRSEIDKLAKENSTLHEQYAEKIKIEKEYDYLSEQEQLLFTVLSTF